MVTASGFAATPITRALLFTLTSTSILASLLQVKHYLPIQPVPHLWPYLQFWRLLTFQLAQSSSIELLFIVSLLYQFRVLERLWGSRKYASFLLCSYALCGMLTVGLALFLKITTLGTWGYVPSGMTGLVVSVLAVWRTEVPMLSGMKIVLDENTMQGFLLSDKWTVYVLAGQLALSQFPWCLPGALVGWIVGRAWTEDFVPVGLSRWRVPGWIVGEEGGKGAGRGRYEGLRRRLEEEGGAADGMRQVHESPVEPREVQGQGLMGTLRGWVGGS